MSMIDLSSASSIDLKTASTIAEGVKVNYFQENYVLCSDGFWSMANGSEIAHVVWQWSSLYSTQAMSYSQAPHRFHPSWKHRIMILEPVWHYLIFGVFNLCVTESCYNPSSLLTLHLIPALEGPPWRGPFLHAKAVVLADEKHLEISRSVILKMVVINHPLSLPELGLCIIFWRVHVQSEPCEVVWLQLPEFFY